ncbi:hypothetical protein BD310DRAFT_932512 [Dichomitus squalens]|uniref:Uncharacterized protein n=1 Tax=Dichomitus squalens TaxID=114155 RepID=A0A4Q9PNQ6_9APHY|nr:hypothetical protein BD310DRAFT_932512 [Dichomitus squalens]
MPLFALDIPPRAQFSSSYAQRPSGGDASRLTLQQRISHAPTCQGLKRCSMSVCLVDCSSESHAGRLPHNTPLLFETRWPSSLCSRRVLNGLLMLFLVTRMSTLVRAQAEELNLQGPDPAPRQCKSTTFSWTGGTPPYDLLIKGNDSDNALRDSHTSDLSYTWDPVDFPSGTALFAILLDSTGQSSHGNQFTVGDSGSSDCLALVPSAPTTTSTFTTLPQSDLLPSATAKTSPSLSSKSKQALSIGAIAAIIVASALAALLAAGAFFYLRRRRRLRAHANARSLGAAQYDDARSSFDEWPDERSHLSKAGERVTSWDANLFVRAKSPAASQVKDSLLASLMPSPGLEQDHPPESPSPNSSDAELLSLGDSGSDTSEVAGVLSSHPPLSPSLVTDYRSVGPSL